MDGIVSPASQTSSDGRVTEEGSSAYAAEIAVLFEAENVNRKTQ
jgi:hypothetical protein